MGRRRNMSYTVIAAVAAAAVIGAGGGAVIGAAHAQDGGDVTLPTWIKTLFGFYAAGDIGDGEIIRALEYLINDGVINVGSGEAAATAMSEEAKSLTLQADIAECLADESRTLIAGWELNLRAARDYTSDEYGAEMRDMITAGRASVQATDAWATMARQAAADGKITAAERTEITAADDYMAAADADLFDAMMNTAAGQFMGAFTDSDSGFFEGMLQAYSITGGETECY